MADNKGPKTVKVDPPKELAVVPTTVFAEASEVETQIAAAHRRPRNVAKFLEEAMALATLTEEIAESCLYRLKRWDSKLQREVPLVGPSVRLAEICLSFWGNCHAGSRPLEETPRFVRAQGVCWDVERNVRISMDATRGILTKGGARFSDDLVRVTMAAAQGIAFRNSVFKIIPVALVDEILEAAKKAAIGEVPTKRAKVIKRLGDWGASVDRVLASLDRKSIEEITVGDLEILIASGQALKAGDQTVDELFPPLVAAATTAATPAVATGHAVATQTTPAAAPAAVVTAATATGPKQGTLADVAARNRPRPPSAGRSVDDVIDAPPSRLSSVPPEDPEEAANRKAAEPGPDEMAPWMNGDGQ